MKWGRKVKVPVQDAWVGRAGALPPPPGSVGGAVGGGGGEDWRAGSILGILSREGGSLASKPRVEMADFSGE
jgi:hypothetical protein